MHMNTKVVALTLPADLVAVIDRAAARSLKFRAGYLRDVILERLRRDGLVRVERDDAGAIYSLDTAEVQS